MARPGRPTGGYASRALVLKAFLAKNSELCFTDICSTTGLATEAVSKRLKELVVTGKLTKRREGKKQLYRPVSLQDCDEPLIIEGPRKERQVQRLIRMGLKPMSDFIWIKRPRGRPKRLPGFDEDLRLFNQIHALPPAAIRYVAKQAGLDFHERDQGSAYVLTYTEKQVATIRKMIGKKGKAMKHYDALKRQSQIGRRASADSAS